MKHDTNDDPELSAFLHSLPADESPTSALIDRAVNALRSEGLLVQRATPARPYVRLAAAVAAGALLFVGGYASRAFSAADAAFAPTHALLLYGAETANDAEHERRAQEYADWATQPRATDRVLGGEALGRTSIVLNGEPDAFAGASTDSAVLTGYFLISANSAQAAAKLARTCPHLRHGGTVVVREISPS